MAGKAIGCIDGKAKVGHAKVYEGPEHMKAEKELEALRREHNQLLKMTEQLDEHPDGYDGPCMCRLCQSYA